jgi:hypothetical protein
LLLLRPVAFLSVLLQHPANALVHRPMLLEYILAEKIKVRSSSSSGSSGGKDSSSRCGVVLARQNWYHWRKQLDAGKGGRKQAAAAEANSVGWGCVYSDGKQWRQQEQQQL